VSRVDQLIRYGQVLQQEAKHLLIVGLNLLLLIHTVSALEPGRRVYTTCSEIKGRTKLSLIVRTESRCLKIGRRVGCEGPELGGASAHRLKSCVHRREIGHCTSVRVEQRPKLSLTRLSVKGGCLLWPPLGGVLIPAC
jgi:hypothetical protein